MMKFVMKVSLVFLFDGSSARKKVLQEIAANKWELNSIDIKRAFLQSNEIEREVFIRPPKEACTDKIWCLKKCVYGLADAPRTWYITFSQSLIELGCSVSKYDPGVFLFFSDGSPRVFHI